MHERFDRVSEVLQTFRVLVSSIRDDLNELEGVLSLLKVVEAEIPRDCEQLAGRFDCLPILCAVIDNSMNQLLDVPRRDAQLRGILPSAARCLRSPYSQHQRHSTASSSGIPGPRSGDYIFAGLRRWRRREIGNVP